MDEIQYAVIQDLDRVHKNFDRMHEGIRDLRNLLDARIPMRVQKTEDSLIKSQVIPADSSIDTSEINQEDYNRARLFLGVGFGTASVGDVVVDLYFQNHKVRRVLTVKKGTSTGGVSQSFDVQHLTGFYFKISNLDASNAITIKNARIVLYNGTSGAHEEQFTGRFYSDNFTAPDAASEAALGSVKLRDCVIKNTHATYEAELRKSGGDFVELAAGASIQLSQIDLATVFCKAQLDTENPVLDIFGTEV